MYTFFTQVERCYLRIKKRGWSRAKGMTMLLFCSNTQELLKNDMSTLNIGLSKKTLCFHAHNVINTVNNFRSFGFMFKSGKWWSRDCNERR